MPKRRGQFFFTYFYTMLYVAKAHVGRIQNGWREGGEREKEL